MRTNHEIIEALKAAKELIPIARRYFPKSVNNSNRFQLELTCATVESAIKKAEDNDTDKALLTLAHALRYVIDEHFENVWSERMKYFQPMQILNGAILRVVASTTKHEQQ